MKRAIFLMLDDYADWEGAYLASQLNQSSNWSVKTASITTKITSIGGLKTIVDYSLVDIPKEIDLLVLIGGNSWTIQNDSLLQLIKNQIETGKSLAAICGSVDYLARNGLLTGFKHTGNAKYLWKDYANYQNGADFIEQQVVSNKNLITANGTAALEFTNAVLKLVDFDTELRIDKITDLYELGYYQYCAKYGKPIL
ncbi:type 1 glutamine amidotransferase family protein [Companilactobacillus halodurans]|uniref:Glutamine amidotransferase n=1 Tax=Companilactobacillus halodurans TaxID=2584183 RepID=A0A5P0ZVE5_9LACO|nr:type 1 glutamine amidotransferase family protein [Companilactobacillus halodurans]MQS76375.1 glutamine amidotransferase [Companilactobacillus halodurans]MQS96999.1 glutamine amidotransferase [Companilactobacillus halodurans]